MFPSQNFACFYKIMTHTPASHETRLGILEFEKLNLYEAKGLLNTWKFLLSYQSIKITPEIIHKAHRHGFGFLYEWAGTYRRSSPLVGQLELCPPHILPEQVKNLCDDLEYRLNNLDADNIEHVVQLITWFEHRFICLHPYQNTNGRMGRMLTNYILVQLSYPPLIYANRSKNRDRYIHAMRSADNGNFSPLENIIAQELDSAISQYNQSVSIAESL